MPLNGLFHSIRDALHGRLWQGLAIGFCLLFATAMVANTQMGGEGMWFWYAQLFHGGMKLYADMHLALQPLYVLAADGWIRTFGIRCWVTEAPSLLEVLIYCIGILLILRESQWPDWQKGILLASAFILSVQMIAYRFDDYHILADTFILYSLFLLLRVARATGLWQLLWLSVGLGMLSGLTMMTRLNDGVALLCAAVVCLVVLAMQREWLCAVLFFAAAVLTVTVVLRITGDSLRDYAMNSIFRAAGSKGGAHSILAYPFLVFRNAIRIAISRQRFLMATAALCMVGALLQRRWKVRAVWIVAVQLVLALVVIALCSRDVKGDILNDYLAASASVCFIVLSYVLVPVVFVRYMRSRRSPGLRGWNPREALVLVILAEVVSASASTAAEPRNAFYAQMAMLLLLVPVVWPSLPSSRPNGVWVAASFVAIVALLGVSGVAAKVHNPYSWNNYWTSRMFKNRQWYQHPTYGRMYIDRDLLQFVEPVCAEIVRDSPQPELLSLPYSYPNYFCNTPPWHGYVQTFFDTSTSANIHQLMNELETSPPQWIVYQRQTKLLQSVAKVYQRGQPLAQRDLDELIERKIASGEWQLVENRHYLEGDGWLIVRTR